MCQAITLSMSVLTTVVASPNDPTVADGIARLRALRDIAPVEIRGDLQVIADFDANMVAAVRSGRSPEGVGETPPVTRALSHQAQWTATHCTH